MLPLLSLQEASSLDRTLIENYSLDESSLVTNAALGAYEECRHLFSGRSVLFVTGKGNNGSDALALAELVLGDASSVRIYCHYEDGNSENMKRRSALPSSLFVTSPVESDIIVDGLFGVNCRKITDERTLSLIKRINSSSSFVISLDVPSGFLVEADLTVTFMCHKREMYYPENRGKCGRITCFNPGFPASEICSENSWLLEDSDYIPLSLSPSDYKNTRGHVIVAAGSSRYPGAAILSSLAAFHAGSGKVSVISTPEVRSAVLSSWPSIMCTGDIAGADSYVAGPGWDDGDRKLLERIMASGLNYVVDADAIKLLGNENLSSRAVVTPHIGEFRTLRRILMIEEDDVYEAVKEASLRLGGVIVLKGPSVLISDGTSLFVAAGGEPSLGVAGSGDVLSGITGALLAYGLSPLESAVQAVLLHQMSGREARASYGFYSAETLIEVMGRKR